MNNKIRTDAVDHLFDAILTLKNKEEFYTFFEDVCTVNELLSLSQRYEVAKMLREKKTYLEIAEETGASTATISRVNRSLNNGNEGYDLVFKRLGKFDTDKKRECPLTLLFIYIKPRAFFASSSAISLYLSPECPFTFIKSTSTCLEAFL